MILYSVPVSFLLLRTSNTFYSSYLYYRKFWDWWLASKSTFGNKFVRNGEWSTVKEENINDSVNQERHGCLDVRHITLCYYYLGVPELDQTKGKIPSPNVIFNDWLLSWIRKNIVVYYISIRCIVNVSGHQEFEIARTLSDLLEQFCV